MIINSQTIALTFEGFKSVCPDAFLQAPSHSARIAMTVPGTGSDDTHAWLGMFPQLREWIGQRHVNNLKAHGFKIQNRTFESTVPVRRNHMSDDRPGVFRPLLAEMGHTAKRHPDELIFGLLREGFSTGCFDGETFLSASHPVEIAGRKSTFSNYQAGSKAPWFLLDTGRAIRPIIWQEREPCGFQALDDPNSHHVFMNDEFIHGVRARVNAGFGLWQLGFGSKADLNEASHSAARAAMMGFKGDGGRAPGVSPSVPVVPPEPESAALHLLNTEIKTGGGSNPWKGTAGLIVTPHVAA